MAAAKQATLTLKLIDQVTGPARAISGVLGQLSGTMQALRGVSAGISRMGNQMRQASAGVAGLSAPLGLAGMAAAQDVYAFEKAGNDLQAVASMTDTQREQIEDLAQILNSDFPATNADIMNAAVELAKAGMAYEQINGSLRNTLNLALAGDFGIPESSKILVAAATAMRLPMESAQQAAETTAKVADVLAYAANRSLADIPDLGVTLKYVAPAAAAAGMSIDELGAAMAVMANNGILGSNAGTGLRYALLQLMSPSNKALEAFAKLNLNIGDFVTGAQQVKAVDLVNWLHMDGIDLHGLGLESAMQSILDDPAISKSPPKLAAELSSLITDAIGEEGIVDNAILAESLKKNLAVLGTQVDLLSLMEAFRTNPNSEAYFADIFGKQHAAKMMGLLAGDLPGMVKDFRENAAGAADEMSGKRMKGLIGDWNDLTAAIEAFNIALGDSGLVADAAKGMQALAAALADLTASNPDLLRFGSYAALAIAAMAPLGFVASGLASSLALLTNPITITAAALGTLAYANWGGITGFLESFKTSFVDNLSPESLALIEGVMGSLQDLVTIDPIATDTWNTWGGNLGATFADLANKIPPFIEQMQGLKIDLTPVLNELQPLLDSFGATLSIIRDDVAALGGAAWDGFSEGIRRFNAAQDPEAIAQLNEWARALRDFVTAKNNADNAMMQQGQGGGGQYEWLSDLGGRAGQAFGGLPAGTLKEIEAIKTAWTNFEAWWDTFAAEIRTKVSGAFNIDLFAAGQRIIDTLIAGLRANFPALGVAVDAANAIVRGIGAIPGLVGRTTDRVNANQGVVPTNNPSAVINGQPDSGIAVPDPVPGHAKGGALAPGWFISGEKGPELGYSRGAGHVFNATQTRRALRGGGGGGDTHIWNITGSNAKEIADEVMHKMSQIIDGSLQRSRGVAMEDRVVFG